jgi:hypothetical protein
VKHYQWDVHYLMCLILIRIAIWEATNDEDGMAHAAYRCRVIVADDQTEWYNPRGHVIGTDWQRFSLPYVLQDFPRCLCYFDQPPSRLVQAMQFGIDLEARSCICFDPRFRFRRMQMFWCALGHTGLRSDQPCLLFQEMAVLARQISIFPAVSIQLRLHLPKITWSLRFSSLRHIYLRL